MKLTDVIEAETGAEGSPAPEPGPADSEVSLLLRRTTSKLHRRAEHSGIIADLFRGSAGPESYALLLRNILPAYRAMEQVLPAADWGALFRAAAIAADLTVLCGPGWEASLPLLPAGRRYAHRVAMAARCGAGRLTAHAYVRYLGDLSGGQMLRRLLPRTLGIGPNALSFLEFPAIPDVSAAKTRIRATIGRAAATSTAQAEMLAEAVVAFRLNIAVSEAVKLALPPAGAAA